MVLSLQGNRNRTYPLLLAAALAVVSCDYLGIETASAPSAETGETAVSPAVVAGGPLAAFIDDIPAVEPRELDLQMALTLVAMPLSCVDRPHAPPRDRSTYLDDFVGTRRPGYERNRSFYGCWDWHSAVNSTWAMVRIHKEFPQLPIGGLVIEKRSDHLSATALAGELEFFRDSAGFERPYGWAWLLKLYTELRPWNHPDAGGWADNVEPLATLFSERMVSYLPELERPSRSGAHGNTAFSLAMMLEAARAMGDAALEEAIVEAAVRLFRDDVRCPTAYEPWGSDFLSPCLEEAALMAAVLDPAEFSGWFEEFMPPVTSPDFVPLTMPIDVSREPAAEAGEAEESTGTGEAGAAAGAGDTTTPPQEAAADVAREGETAEQAPGEQTDVDDRAADEARRELASRSHLIGLAFVRADAMNRIAAALPAGDRRAEAYRKLADLHGAMGFEAMFDADYAGSHWIGTFALKYLLSDR